MIGKYQIELGASQFASGMSTSDYATDGALGISSQGMNPFSTPGLMRAMAASTTISSPIVGNLIASCEDSNGVSPNKRYFIDDSTNAANYYYYSGSTVTKVKTGTATGTTYVQGKTDFISYNGFFYASSPTVLNKWDGSATLTEAYKSFGDTNAMHPMIQYRNLLYIGDGVNMSTLDNIIPTFTPAAFTIGPKEKIVALGIDPATGLMMISFQTVYDSSDTTPSTNGVYLWDGISTTPSRKILVDDLVTAFLNVEGIVYCAQGLIIGTWNGNGVTYVRKLLFATFTNTDLVYKHHWCNTRNILHIIDGKNILSYGTVMDKKGWFYTAYNTSNTTHLNGVFPLGSYKIGTSWNPSGTSEMDVWDFTSTSAGVLQMYFNNIYFPRPIYVRRVRVITTGFASSNGAGDGGLTIFDENNITHTTQQASFLVTAAQAPRYVFDFDFSNLKLQGLQLRGNMDSFAVGFVRFIIYYDIAE